MTPTFSSNTSNHNSSSSSSSSSPLRVEANGIDKLILHADFFRFLDLAIKVQVLKHNQSSSCKITFTEDDAAKLFAIIKYHFLSNRKQISRLSDKNHETDEVMQNTLNSLCQTLKQQLSLNIIPSNEASSLISPNKKSKGKKAGNAFGIKYSKRQTDFLLNWMMQNKYHPFPDANQISILSLGTGLTHAQVINWTTNVRKRNLKGTVEGGKKPHHFLDFLFLAVHREKGLLNSSRPGGYHIDKKANKRKKDDKLQSEDMRSMNVPNMSHMVTPVSHPGPTESQKVPYYDYFLGYHRLNTGPLANNISHGCIGVSPLPTLFDSASLDNIPTRYIKYQNDPSPCYSRSVSPLHDVKALNIYGSEVTMKDELINSSSTKKRAKTSSDATYKRLNSLTEALNDPETFWTKNIFTDEKSLAQPFGFISRDYQTDLLWNDTEVLQKFTQGGLLSTPRGDDDDDDEDEDEEEDQSVHLDSTNSSLGRTGRGRVSLTEHEIIYILSTDEEDDSGNFLDLDLDENDCIAL